MWEQYCSCPWCDGYKTWRCIQEIHTRRDTNCQHTSKFTTLTKPRPYFLSLWRALRRNLCFLCLALPCLVHLLMKCKEVRKAPYSWEQRIRPMCKFQNPPSSAPTRTFSGNPPHWCPSCCVHILPFTNSQNISQLFNPRVSASTTLAFPTIELLKLMDHVAQNANRVSWRSSDSLSMGSHKRLRGLNFA